MKNGKDHLKIEKGIPLPEVRWVSQNPVVIAMRKMKNGDSFLYPITKRPDLPRFARKAGIVIATRTVDAANVRVWRVKDRPDNQRP